VPNFSAPILKVLLPSIKDDLKIASTLKSESWWLSGVFGGVRIRMVANK